MKLDPDRHAHRCCVCLEALTAVDDVWQETGGWIDDEENPSDGYWWVTFRFAHEQCVRAERDARDVRYELREAKEAGE
jgi:hypothetical protein